MTKKKVEQILRSLDDKECEDIAIALMIIEHDDGKLPVDDETYDKYKNVYKYYFNERDDLTGMLNEVLQNPNEIEYEKEKRM
ncbi:MAG: hypothetical protein PHN42_04690 [Bacilli bacterium]|nr:hypothetical protein [Bacilli bacterium]